MELYNQRSPAVKRLMKEAQELREATEDYFAQPLDDNLFEWHFTVRGPPDSDFEGGIYHGRIILPSEYPMKPPNIIIITPNGRFETNKKICLSISGHHPESWQPSWSLRTAMLAIIGFMPTEGQGAIGSLECSSEERKKLARKSVNFNCPHCGNLRQLLKEPSSSGLSAANKEAKELAVQVSFTSENTNQQAQQDDSHATSGGLQSSVPEINTVHLQSSTSSSAATPTTSAGTLNEVRQRFQSEQPPASAASAPPSTALTTPQRTRIYEAVNRPTFTLNGGGLLSALDLRALVNVFMIICAAGFLSLCVRRVCFL